MPRVLVTGFDGATLDLCERFMAEGQMPVLRSLCDDGSFGPMRSVFPYNSAVAWASLATGANPGRHGIFDFLLPRPGHYALRVATRSERRVPAVWNYASDAGARVGVVNIPMTFPAEEVQGVMVSGMDAPSLEKRAVHPPDLLDLLRRTEPGYRIMSQAAVKAARGDFDAAERELIEVVEARSRFGEELARPRDLDLLMINLEATDGAHHFFWQHHDPSHPRHDRRAARKWAGTIPRVYATVDRGLGRLIDAFDPDAVLVVSDHGGGPSSDWVVFLNDWLAQEGFLSMATRPTAGTIGRLYSALANRLSVPLKRRLRPILGGVIERTRSVALYGGVDWARSRAYAVMNEAARLNLAGREPAGAVGSGEADEVLEELAARAAALSLPDGTPALAAARRASEVYTGEAPGGPDLVFEFAPGLHARGRNPMARPAPVVGLPDLGFYLPSGVHTPVGVVAAVGKGVRSDGRVPESDIHQVAASILAVMGIPSPPLDGEPFSFIEPRAPSAPSSRAPHEEGGEGLAPEEEEEVLDRLRGLGYVD